MTDVVLAALVLLPSMGFVVEGFVKPCSTPVTARVGSRGAYGDLTPLGGAPEERKRGAFEDQIPLRASCPRVAQRVTRHSRSRPENPTAVTDLLDAIASSHRPTHPANDAKRPHGDNDSTDLAQRRHDR